MRITNDVADRGLVAGASHPSDVYAAAVLYHLIAPTAFRHDGDACRIRLIVALSLKIDAGRSALILACRLQKKRVPDCPSWKMAHWYG